MTVPAEGTRVVGVELSAMMLVVVFPSYDQIWHCQEGEI